MSCFKTVEKFAAIGANEIVCLIDFGVDFDTTMSGLEHLARLAELTNQALSGLAATLHLVPAQ